MKNALTIAYVAAGFLVGLLLRALWMQPLPFGVKVAASVGGIVIYLSPMVRMLTKPKTH